MKIAPSILAADFSKLREEIKDVENAGADIIHLDVMDGHFVPNITFGPVVVKGIRKLTDLPLDAHLMITDPEKYAERFIEAGSNMISFHIETVSSPEILIDKLKKKNVKVGIAVNPETPIKSALPFLDSIDYILIMSVHPGFYGQEFIPSVLDKVRDLKRSKEVEIEVDGGINDKTKEQVIEAGVDIIVSGAYIFKSENRINAIKKRYEGRTSSYLFIQGLSVDR